MGKKRLVRPVENIFFLGLMGFLARGRGIARGVAGRGAYAPSRQKPWSEAQAPFSPPPPTMQ